MRRRDSWVKAVVDGEHCRIAYIYGLADPVTGEVRYVGKADDPRRRLKCHLVPNAHGLRHNPELGTWIRELRSRGMRPLLRILELVSFDKWQDAEKRWIAKLPNLANITVGGLGMHDPTGEVNRRIGLKLRGRSPWNKGLKQTPEQCKNHARAMLGKPGYWKGKHLLPHVIEALREAHRGLSPPNKGKPLNEDTRLKISKRWLLKSPDGETFNVVNLKSFCKQHGLADSLLNAVAAGRRNHHKGWTAKCIGWADAV